MRSACALVLTALALSRCGGPPKEGVPAHAAPAAAVPLQAPADTNFRAQPPPAAPAARLHAPVPTQTTLANGLTVLTVHKPGLPVEHATLIVRSGSAQDPRELEGLAGFAGDMLEMGTTTLSASAFAERIEGFGTGIDVAVDEDAISLGMTALTDQFGGAFMLMADMVQRPALAPAEIERVRKSRAASLAQVQDSPTYAASAALRRALFGTHPYGHLPLGNAEALARIRRRHLSDFLGRHLRPANAALVLVGSLDDRAAVAEAERAFAGWQGASGPTARVGPPVELAPEVDLVARPEAPQSQLLLGQLGVARTDPDYYSLLLANAILGGSFSSRINMNLREDKGYTYGASSAFDFMRQRGPFFISTGVRTDATEPALSEILREVRALCEADISAEELQHAKNRYSLTLPSHFQTVDKVAHMMATLFLFDLPRDYYAQLPAKVEAVTVADVRGAAERHLQADKLTVVVVGDPKQVEAKLAQLGRGPVRRRQADGNLL